MPCSMVPKCLQKPHHRSEFLHRCVELTAAAFESGLGTSGIATRIKHHINTARGNAGDIDAFRNSEPQPALEQRQQCLARMGRSRPRRDHAPVRPLRADHSAVRLAFLHAAAIPREGGRAAPAEAGRPRSRDRMRHRPQPRTAAGRGRTDRHRLWRRYFDRHARPGPRAVRAERLVERQSPPAGRR